MKLTQSMHRLSKCKQITLLFLTFILASCTTVTPTPTAVQEVVTVPVITETDETGTSTVAEEITSPVEWFIPPVQVDAGWEVSLAPGQTEIILLEPKNGEVQFRLLFILTRGHTLFDRAVEVVLTTFRDRGITTAAAVALAMEPETKTADVAKVMATLAYGEENNYDLVYPIGSEATAVLHDEYSDGLLPVVALLAKDPVLLGQTPSYSEGSGTNIAYTSVSVPVDIQMIYFRQLIPELKNIIVLYDENNTSTVKTQVEPLDTYAQDQGINVIHLAVTQVDTNDATRAELEALFPAIMSELRSSDPENKQSIFLLTNSGSIVQVFDTVVELAEEIPVVSLLPDLVQEGEDSAVMSVGVSFDSNSILSAVYGVRILEEGVSPGDLPVGVITPPDIAINFLKAREIDLRIPFTLFESATYIYDAAGSLVREKGQRVP
ncbi:MAG: hypothetical protein JW726_03020 [Anaerolineales bacterium]|nr:hypothetical protein [Anaerolineales bacterium]